MVKTSAFQADYPGSNPGRCISYKAKAGPTFPDKSPPFHSAGTDFLKMKKPEWSIVIPALNEERYLPRLLESIRRQDFDDHEVILVDSDSDDNTVDIAKSYGCRVLSGKRGNPGINRNIGAKHARGEHIIFFDADVVLPEGFLRTT